MRNMIDICKDFGIEIPAEKHADFLKAVNGEYKTVSDYNKQVEKTNTATKRAETAEEALKGFDGIDPAKVSEQLAEANRKVKEAQESAQKQLDERDFEDALKTGMEKYQFTSEAAKRDIMSQIRAKGLKASDGVILGLDQYVEQLRKADESAFVDEKQQNLEQNRARFTQPNGGMRSDPQLSNLGSLTMADYIAARKRK